MKYEAYVEGRRELKLNVFEIDSRSDRKLGGKLEKLS